MTMLKFSVAPAAAFASAIAAASADARANVFTSLAFASACADAYAAARANVFTSLGAVTVTACADDCAAGFPPSPPSSMSTSSPAAWPTPTPTILNYLPAAAVILSGSVRLGPKGSLQGCERGCIDHDWSRLPAHATFATAFASAHASASAHANRNRKGSLT